MAFDVQGFQQPNYQVNPVAGNKYAPQDGMTQLGNLLDYQTKNLALQKQQALQQPQIEQGIAQAEAAKTGAEQAQFTLKQSQAEKAKGLVFSLLTSPNWSDPTKMEDEFGHVERVAHYQGLPKDPNGPLEEIKSIYKKDGGDAARQRLFQLTTGNQVPSTQLETAIKGLTGPAPLQKTETQAQPSADNVPEFSKPEKAYYQVPVAGQVRAQLPSEEADRTFGEKMRLGLKQQQQGYSSQKQNIDNLYDKATSMVGGNIFQDSALGTGIRKLEAMAGSPEYQELEKMLARVQLGQMTTDQQANTDMGRQMTAVANGQSHLDPKIIVNITRQNAANLERFNAQANAAEKAGQKHGDANLTRKFQTEWNKNSDDNRIFEMKYIFNHAKSPEEGRQAVVDYIQSQPTSKRKELGQKYMNLKKLEAEGGL